MCINGLKDFHLQIISEMPMMRTFRQTILSTILTSRKVRFTSASENSSRGLFIGLTLLVIMSTRGGSAIELSLSAPV